MTPKLSDKKIIACQSDLLRNPPKRKNIDNMLLISGGGIVQVMFSMGAIQCLIENNLFDFDVISSVSGGTVTLLLIELCYSFGYTNEVDWFRKYVHNAAYSIAEQKTIHQALKYPTVQNLQDLVFKALPQFNKYLTTKYTKIIFEYNYLDITRDKISCDHTDIIDLSKNIKEDNWYFIQTARGCLPYTNFYDKSTYDGGVVQNISVNTSLSKYNSKNVIIICAGDYMTYENYINVTNIYDIIFDISNSSNYEGRELAQAILENSNTTVCTMSNSKNTSQDKYHRGVFTDNIFYVLQFLQYNFMGTLYSNTPMLRVLENEGYIQMYYELKRKKIKNLKKFTIPNPEVYNENVKKIYQDCINQSVLKQFILDFF